MMSNKVMSIPELDTPLPSNDPSKSEVNDPQDPFDHEIDCTRDVNNGGSSKFSVNKTRHRDITPISPSTIEKLDNCN